MPSAQSAAPAEIDLSTVVVPTIDVSAYVDVSLDVDVSADVDVDESDATDESASTDTAPGGLLQELERRQDAVLAQIDDLDAKVTALLSELGVTLTADPEDAQL